MIADTFSRQHFITLLLVGFSGASLLLAAIGIYGILTYAVSERTREIGLRVALGATPERIVTLVVRAAAARPVVGGFMIGIAGALALTGLLRSLLFEISPRDPADFCGGARDSCSCRAHRRFSAGTAGVAFGSYGRLAQRVVLIAKRTAAQTIGPPQKIVQIAYRGQYV